MLSRSGNVGSLVNPSRPLEVRLCGRSITGSTRQLVEAWPHVVNVNTQLLNLQPWRHQKFFFSFSFRTSFFDYYKFYNIPFIGFLRRSTKLKEVFGWNKYPQRALIFGPQHRQAWSVSPTDYPYCSIHCEQPHENHQNSIKIPSKSDCTNQQLWWS